MAKLDPRLGGLVAELRAVLRERGIQLQQVDAEKGWAKGYLSQVINGHRDMKLAHLFDALEVAGVDPLDFFGRLSGFAPPGPLAEIRRRLEMVEEKVSHEEREPRPSRVGGLGR